MAEKGGGEEDEFVDIEHDGEFARIKNSLTNYDDCPQIEVREFVPCRSIAEHLTPLSFKRVAIKVPSSEVKKGGFFSYDYALFNVETEIGAGARRNKVQRRDADFYTLRRLVKSAFPHVLVPPLPAKNNKLVDKVLMKRQKQFTRFLQAVARSEVLKSSKFLYDFLTEHDQKKWALVVKAEEKSKHSRLLSDLASVDGRANVQLN